MRETTQYFFALLICRLVTADDIDSNIYSGLVTNSFDLLLPLLEGDDDVLEELSKVG